MTGLEPSALNFRGDEVVTLSGDLFYDAPTLECAFDGAVAGPATFVSATEAVCMAPPGEAGTQVDVGLYVNGRAFTTLAGRLQYESDPSAVDETPIVLYGVVGGGILAVLLILVAVILCCCLRNGKDASYLPPKLTAAQERDLMFGKHDGVSHGKVRSPLSPGTLVVFLWGILFMVSFPLFLFPCRAPFACMRLLL